MRTQGAKDLKKRKLRKDIGKKRKKYAGKKIVRFKKKKGKKTEIKMQFKSIDEMSRDGFHNWNKRIRSRVKRVVYGKSYCKGGFVVPVNLLSNKEVLEDTMVSLIQGAGNFQALGYSGSLRSSHKIKPVEMFRFTITEHPTGLRCNMYKNTRLFRYWFWRK